MPSRLTPYIGFGDSAREAMEFYRSVFGGKLTVSTFKDYHASEDPGDDNKIMHAQLEADNGMMLMGADTPKGMVRETGARISIALSGNNEAELSGYYQKLSEGGTVIEPLKKAPWGDSFGMLKDRFDVEWMVNISGAKA